MDLDSFRQRQAADLARYEDADGEYVIHRRPFHERVETMTKREEPRVYELDEDAMLTDEDVDDEAQNAPYSQGGKSESEGEESWRNKEGERLADFGVDEVAEFYDEEDDVPLSELMRRRRME